MKIGDIVFAKHEGKLLQFEVKTIFEEEYELTNGIIIIRKKCWEIAKLPKKKDIK